MGLLNVLRHSKCAEMISIIAIRRHSNIYSVTLKKFQNFLIYNIT